MPPRAQGPRLWARPARRDNRRRITHPAVWLILDGNHQQSTRCGLDDRAGAERALGSYIAEKHIDRAASQGERDPAQIAVADVLGLYAREKAPEHARPVETAQRIEALLDFFGEMKLSQITGASCRAYAKTRASNGAARRELEDLRSAINHYHREGHVRKIVKVTLPVRAPARDRWLTRSEAAKLLSAAWRYKEKQLGSETTRHTRRHVARFIVVALYAGRRAGAIVEAALQREPGRGWIDLERGVFFPKTGRAQSKKRQPAIPLPRRLLAHMRRWKASGQRYVIEWNQAPIGRMAKAFRSTVKDAGLGPDVTPHILRHTSATWLMQRAADPWAAAGYLGLSLETLVRVYGHHHPDHLKGAWSVFDRPGGQQKAPQSVAGKGKLKAPVRVKVGRK